MRTLKKDTVRTGRTAIRLCATVTLLVALANMPLALFGTLMAMMNSVGFFAMIASMFVLVVIAAGLSVWALTRPRWWSVTIAAVCCLPASVTYIWLLTTP